MKPENRPKIVFEGKGYDDYTASQAQRRIERTVRKLRREEAAFEAAGLVEDAQAVRIRIGRLQKEYEDFSKAAGLPLQRERMEALYTDRTSEEKAAARAEAVANSSEYDKISISQRNEAAGVGKVCDLDIEKYKCVTPDITTREVIITDERIEHIRQRHPDDYERFCSYLPEIIKEPDYIIEANKNNTAVVLKEIEAQGEKFKLILRLKTESDPIEYKNSILSFWQIGETTWRKLLKNKKILYKGK